jgi:hypothetical protein
MLLDDYREHSLCHLRREPIGSSRSVLSLLITALIAASMVSQINLGRTVMAAFRSRGKRHSGDVGRADGSVAE